MRLLPVPLVQPPCPLCHFTTPHSVGPIVLAEADHPKCDWLGSGKYKAALKRRLEGLARTMPERGRQQKGVRKTKTRVGKKRRGETAGGVRRMTPE